jgi:hypothetical protein
MRSVRNAVMVAGLLLLPACALVDRMSGEGEANRIRRTGQSADAVVLAIWDTGITVNNDPIVAFRLRVRPPTGDPYEVETRGRVSRLHVPQVQPGAVLPVAIDPADPMKVAIAIYGDR